MALDYEVAQATIWMEARGEGFEGMLAVAWVIVNRLRSDKFGPTLGHVCLQPYQFSCWNTHDPNRQALAAAEPLAKAWLESEQALFAALHPKAPDPTDGALYYCEKELEGRPPFDRLLLTARIGKHSFFK